MHELLYSSTLAESRLVCRLPEYNDDRILPRASPKTLLWSCSRRSFIFIAGDTMIVICSRAYFSVKCPSSSDKTRSGSSSRLISASFLIERVWSSFAIIDHTASMSSVLAVFTNSSSLSFSQATSSSLDFLSSNWVGLEGCVVALGCLSFFKSPLKSVSSSSSLESIILLWDWLSNSLLGLSLDSLRVS